MSHFPIALTEWLQPNWNPPHNKNPLVKEALNQGEICYAFTLQSKNYLFLIAA